MEATQVATPLSRKYRPEPSIPTYEASFSESALVPRLAGEPANTSRRVRVAAGVALAITSGSIAQTVHKAPQYEGKFELAVVARSSPSPQAQATNQTISAPALSDQIRVLASPMLIEPVVERLQAQIPNLDYATVKENLRITADDSQHLEVRYRNANPQTAQLVLEQLAQAYVDYSQQCQSSTCHGISFIETQVPQTQQQIKQLRTEIEQLYQQNGLSNLDLQTRLLNARTTAVSRQKAEVNGKILQANQQYTELQSRMSLQPNEAIGASILAQNPRYQELLQQLRAVDQRLAIEFNTLNVRNPNTQTLTAQHQTLLLQLNQEAQQALQQYISNPKSNLQNPIFQEQISLNLLQQSVMTVNYLQVLKITQQAIGQVEGGLKQQRSQLTTVLYKYNHLTQELQSRTQVLQQYLDRLKVLKAQPTQQTALQVISPPEMLENNTRKIESAWADLQNYAGTIAALGILLGVGAVVGQDELGGAIKRAMLQKMRPVT